MSSNHPAIAKPQAISSPEVTPILPLQASPPRTLVLGLGNDLLGDDAIGLRVARALADRLTNYPHIAVKESDEMGLSLLDLVVGFEALVVVDAIQTIQAHPGAIQRLTGGELNLTAPVSPHFFGVGEMIALGRELGLAVPSQVRIFAIEIRPAYCVTTTMTAELQAALPRIVTEVMGALSL